MTDLINDFECFGANIRSLTIRNLFIYFHQYSQLNFIKNITLREVTLLILLCIEYEPFFLGF